MSSNNIAKSGATQYNFGVTVAFPGRTIQSRERPSNAAIAVQLGSSPTNVSINLWPNAYDLVQGRQQDLMMNYQDNLETICMGRPLNARIDFSESQQVGLIVKQLLEFFGKKEIGISFPVSTNMREPINKLAEFLIQSESIVKAAGTTQPHIALAWSGARLFLELLTKSTARKEEVLNGFNLINDIQIFWKVYGETYFDSPFVDFYQVLRENLTKLYSFIVEYQAGVIYHLSRLKSQSRKLTSIDLNKTIDLIKLTNESCTNLIAEVQQVQVRKNIKLQLEEIKNLRMNQEEVHKTMKQDAQDLKERNLMRDLAEVSKNYVRYKTGIPERVEGTCKWFLSDDRFHKWRESQSSQLLWLSAGPGCGKSVLSKALIDEALLGLNTTVNVSSWPVKKSATDIAVCYFFFKEAGDGEMNITHALCALLHQLFLGDFTSHLIIHALESHKGHGLTLTGKMEDLWGILVECANRSPVPIVCVLDALDECKLSGRDEFIKELWKFYSLNGNSSTPSKLKFLITSRPYVRPGCFENDSKYPNSAAYIHFDGDEKFEEIGQEINLVIDSKVKEIADKFIETDRQKYRDEISKRLKMMENRTYLWLHLTFEIIANNPSAYNRAVDINKFLSILPSKVADAYEKILSRSQNEEKVEALLQIVLAATRPLTLTEANCALTLATEEKRFKSYKDFKKNLWSQHEFKTTVQNLCGLFISIQDSKLLFIHQTARDFLINQKQEGVWKGRLSLPKSHAVLSRVCIKYLKMLDPSSKSPENEYPFSSYAAKSWFVHFRSQGEDTTEKLRKQARKLCRISMPRTKLWMNQVQALLRVTTGTDLCLVSLLGLAAVAYDIIAHEHADVNEPGGLFNHTPLRKAIGKGHLEVMKVLLDPEHGAKITEKDIIAVASGESNAKEMMGLLLNMRSSEVKITSRVLEHVAGNKKFGAAILTLLLEKRSDEVKITEEVVEKAARSGSAKTMSRLLKKCGHQFKITEKIMKAATHNQKVILTRIFKKRSNEAKVTEAVLKEAMTTMYPETLNLLLDHANEIDITADMVNEAVCKGSPDNMAVLLEKRKHDIEITDSIIEAAQKREHQREEMRALLQQR